MSGHFSQHDIDTASRLSAVEVRLDIVKAEVAEFRTHNDKRLDELMTMLVEAQVSRTRNLATVLDWTAKNWKIVLAMIALATGVELSTALGVIK